MSGRITVNDVVSLIIADRLKQTLSEGCLRHVLSVEASSKNSGLAMIS